MASQVIRETSTANEEAEDNVSECTLKDFAKKVPPSRKGKTESYLVDIWQFDNYYFDRFRL